MKETSLILTLTFLLQITASSATTRREKCHESSMDLGPQSSRPKIRTRREDLEIPIQPERHKLRISREETSTLRHHLLSGCPKKISLSWAQEENPSEVQRMRKRSANYTNSFSNDSFNPEQQVGINSTNKLPGITKLPRPKFKVDISQISNYKAFLSDYEFWAGKENGTSLASGKECRHYEYLPKRLFALNSCAHCYSYVPKELFGNASKKWIMTDTEWTIPPGSPPGEGKKFTFSVLLSLAHNMTVFANASGPESALLSSFLNENARSKWLDCCRAAEECCEKIQTVPDTTLLSKTDKATCPPTWDGWQCWDETTSGTSAYEPCPHYIYFSMTEVTSCPVYAEKICESTGDWRSKLNTRTQESREWTNYANCGSPVVEALKRRTYVHVLAYAFSIIAIIPALFVFFVYKQLRVDRIILHRNFLASMLMEGVVVIAFKSLVILNALTNEASGTSIISQNGVGCRLLFILTKYSRLTNYMWMFCESYYLHKLIAAAFAEQKTLLVFYLIGWVFPIVPTLIYAIIRMSDDELNASCWVVPKESIEWIFNGPSLLSLLINMLFLINIIRVLVTKLRAAHANEPSQYRKAVRATLVLLPLFGLHFVVTIYRPASGSGTCEWVEIYYHINDVLDGLQGFLVALIFCYLNGEVVNLVKRTYGRWREQHGAGCTRQSSNSRLRSRQSRGGSMLGRSVVSTQCYSSVPASPETCNATRLTILTPGGTTSPNGGGQAGENNGLQERKQLSPNGLGRNGLTLTTPSTTPTHLNSIVKIRNNDGPTGTWTEVQLNDLSSPDVAPSTSLELRPQKNVRLSPTVTVSGTNGVKGEHQL